MKKVLFIIDAQNDFCHPDGKLNCEGSETAVGNICKLLEKAKPDVVICSYDIHREGYLATNEGLHLPVEHCMDGEWGSFQNKCVYDAMYVYDGHSWRIDKRTFMIEDSEIDDVFNAEERLRDYEDCCEIYICGFATDICVLNNALMLKRHFSDTCEIFLVEDCCAGTTREMHGKAVDIMKVNHINITESDEVIGQSSGVFTIS